MTEKKTPAAKKADDTAKTVAAPPEDAKTTQRGRDAESGKIISAEDAKANPKTSVVETVKPKGDEVELSQAVTEVLDLADEIVSTDPGELVREAVGGAVNYEYDALGYAQLGRTAIIQSAAKLIKAAELLDEGVEG